MGSRFNSTVEGSFLLCLWKITYAYRKELNINGWNITAFNALEEEE